MGYLTVKEFSKIWGISERRINKLCSENRINGAIKRGMIWNIPEDTVKPLDKRTNISRILKEQKKVLILNLNIFFQDHINKFLDKEGYVKEVINDISCFTNKENVKRFLNNLDKYYDGLIIFDIYDEKIKKDIKELLIEEVSKKMHCESSIVLVNSINNDDKLEKKYSEKLSEEIGVRINSINLKLINQKNILFNYENVSENIVNYLVRYENVTGNNVITNGGAFLLNTDDRTDDLSTGQFYKGITNYFKGLKKGSVIWCASTMLEDEWTEEPLEMNFRITNLDAANRGVILDRIFIFSKKNINKFKKNNNLKVYMQNNNVNMLFVDLDEIQEKEPELLKIVGNGWDGIDNEALIVDLPEGQEKRGYISVNKREVKKAYECFKKLKTFSKDLREILK